MVGDIRVTVLVQVLLSTCLFSNCFLSRHSPVLLSCSEGDEAMEDDVPEGLDDKVVQVYRGVGKLLSRYTVGKVPKAFKIIPNLKNWEEVLFLTDPDMWSPQAMFEVRCGQRLKCGPGAVRGVAVLEGAPAGPVCFGKILICLSTLPIPFVVTCFPHPGHQAVRFKSQLAASAALPRARTAAAAPARHQGAAQAPHGAVHGHEKGDIQAGGLLQGVGAGVGCVEVWKVSDGYAPACCKMHWVPPLHHLLSVTVPTP